MIACKRALLIMGRIRTECDEKDAGAAIVSGAGRAGRGSALVGTALEEFLRRIRPELRDRG